MVIINAEAVVIIEECREYDGHADSLCGMCRDFIYRRVRNVGCFCVFETCTFILKVNISWNKGNGGEMRIMYINIHYLRFPRMCFAGLGTMAEITQEDNPLVITRKTFLRVL